MFTAPTLVPPGTALRRSLVAAKVLLQGPAGPALRLIRLARFVRALGGGRGKGRQMTPDVEAVLKAKVVMVVKRNLSSCQV